MQLKIPIISAMLLISDNFEHWPLSSRLSVMLHPGIYPRLSVGLWSDDKQGRALRSARRAADVGKFPEHNKGRAVSFKGRARLFLKWGCTRHLRPQQTAVSTQPVERESQTSNRRLSTGQNTKTIPRPPEENQPLVLARVLRA